MKHTVSWTLVCLAFFASNACTETELHAPLGPDTPIRSNSENAFEFRGSPHFTYEPYEALFETTTYGELWSALEEFFRSWKEDGRVFEDGSSMYTFLHCRLALIRTYYLLGDTEKADTLLKWLHPDTQLDETGFPGGQ